MNPNPAPANANATALLAQLRDIRGLDKIGAWPPGPGWWIVLALILCGLVFAVRKYRHARSWKGDALRTLQALEDNLDGANARASAAELAALLRRIAITRFSRREAASLTGERWLEWLKQNDPRGFDWPQKGRLLIDAPYAPPHGSQSRPILPDHVKNLAEAARAWVK